jgi:hypothetical protein
MQLSGPPRRLVVLACVGLAAACGEGGSSTTGISGGSSYPASVEGTYSATTVTLAEAGGSTDLLAEGVVISLVLTAGGTTTGSMTVPAAYSESGEEEILSLNGTYTYDATTGIATLAHAADTFLRDTTWHAKGTQLKGTFDGGTYTLTVTLDRGS